jgi:hypothetical protein
LDERRDCFAHAVSWLPPICSAVDEPLLQQANQTVVLTRRAGLLFCSARETSGCSWKRLPKLNIDLIDKVSEQWQSGRARDARADHENETALALSSQKRCRYIWTVGNELHPAGISGTSKLGDNDDRAIGIAEAAWRSTFSPLAIAI